MPARFPAIPLKGEDWQRRATGALNHLLNPPFAILSGSTVTDYVDLMLVDANAAPVTVNLPAASVSKNRVLRVKKIDASANAVTVDAAGTEVIDGALTQALAAQWQVMTIVCDGTAWFKL